MAIGCYLEPLSQITVGGTVQLNILDSGSLVNVAGSAATSIRLPPLSSPEQDGRYVVFNTVGQNLTILPPLTAGYVGASLTLGTFNNLAAASIAFTTAGNLIAACAGCRAIGGKWYVINSSQNTATIT